MGGILGRVMYALVLAAVLVAAAWISFSRFVQGKSLEAPDLTKMSVEEATALAASRGLLLVVDAARADFSDEIPSHRIRGQVPAPLTGVKAGQTIRVHLSLGPRTIRVPEMTGMTARTASLALSRAGLKEGVVSVARVPGPGVVAQGMAAGSEAVPVTAVDLLVSRGSADVAYVMPDLIGRDFEKVRASFEARGFRIGGVKSQVYEGAAAGTILRQVPQAGYPVTMKDTLSFVVATSEVPPA
jgi:serine/threonine-protein kinase